MTEQSDAQVEVLLVEDNPGDALLIREKLRLAIDEDETQPRFQVSRVDSLAAAIDFLSRRRVEAIVLDLSLPDSQGIDTIDRILGASPNTPIIVLSGLADQALAVKAVRRGAQDYLVKGQIQGDLLARSLNYAIERQRALDRQAMLVRERLARGEAEAGIQARDEFLSVASHELRTPVTGIKGHAQLLLRSLEAGRLDPERAHRAIQFISEAADRLARLTDDLLDVSRLRQGRLLLDPRPVELAELVESTVTRYRPLLREQYNLRLTISAGATTVYGDPMRLEQVLVNLLGNAVKYSPAGGTIAVDLTPAGGEVVLRVRDQGIGLPEDLRSAVFEPFRRAPTAIEQGLPGLGLGLYICQAIVDSHRGTIWAENNPDRGLTLSVRLPTGPPPAPSPIRRVTRPRASAPPLAPASER